jgi:spoIIIJ-associated protein
VTNNQHPRPRTRDEAGRSPAQDVTRFCKELVDRLHFDLEVEAHEEEEIVTVNLSGPDRPALLANTAVVLNSLEYIVNKAFRTGKDEEIATIILDSEQYRKHRESELKLLAQIASQKVLAQRRPLNLQPMSPRERRIVHLALAEIEGVRSQSDGEGDHRSITIYPAK